MELLKRGWPAGEEARYDADAVLVLCRMRDFRDGLLFLYERMRLFREVMQVCGKVVPHSWRASGCSCTASGCNVVML